MWKTFIREIARGCGNALVGMASFALYIVIFIIWLILFIAVCSLV